jgi:hypothetical protein
MEGLNGSELDALNRWLASNGYTTVEDWMLDSDYFYSQTAEEWFSVDDGPFGGPYDPEETAFAAMEACGEAHWPGEDQ